LSSGNDFRSAETEAPTRPLTDTATVRRPSQREHILDAAETVVRDDGAAHLTLDAVADRAGVSKGGLLYHFRSKESLLQAMIDRHMQTVADRHADALASVPPGPGRELKAWALLSIAHLKNPQEKRMSCSMLAAAANDPRLVEPFQEFQERRRHAVEAAAAAGLPYARAAVIMLALDGLALLELHQLSPYATHRRAILDDILALIDETAAGAAPTSA
jgi:AcrR family transcriptional regulator